MKKLLLLTLMIGSFSCSKEDLSWKEELEKVKQELADHKSQLSSQQQQLDDLRTIIDAIQESPIITGISENEDSYVINFSNGQSVEIKNGKTPLLTIGDNGNWYIDGADSGTSAKGIDGINSPVIEKIEVSGENMVFYFSDGSQISVNIGSLFENFEKKHYSSFSVLGDSYSTFAGYVTPISNSSYYPNMADNPDVDVVEDLWWHKFSKKYDSVLQVNNSYSGSPICYDGYAPGSEDAKFYSFLSRCNNLAQSELIIIEGGTNDSWAGAKLGEYKYSKWTDDDYTKFRPALAGTLDYITKHYKESKIVFLLNYGLKAEINESVKTICEYFHVPVLPLEKIDTRSGHPTEKGMEQIADNLIKFLEKL